MNYLNEMDERLFGERIPGELELDEHQCEGCGCSQTNPCEGGCVWATEDLCSACALGDRS
jgi:hypothetical protein